jgi:hypothetical protein
LCQIYVENRETVPYPAPCRGIWSTPSLRPRTTSFICTTATTCLGIIRAAVKNAVAGHVRQGASTVTQQLARNSFELKGKTFRRKLLEMFVARGSRIISRNRKSWSSI